MDIAPELLKEIQEDFNKQFEQNQRISEIQSKIDEGVATYKEANEYAIEVGEMLASAFQNNLSSAVLPNGQMYYNIAQKVIRPNMLNNYDLVTAVTNNIQAALNKAANIGIKAITPQLNEDKVDGIVRKISNAEQFDDVAAVLNEPIVTFTQSIIDDAIKANAEFQSKAGLQPKIVRTMAGGCCKWCQEVAGTYRYPDEVPKDVYRRHQNCRCTVEFHPKDGKVQNVHSKRWVNSSATDYMGKTKIQKIELGGKLYEIKTYQNVNYENISCQTYSSDSQKMCEYLNEVVNGKYTNINEIVVAKYNALGGIAAYDHVDNKFYISEELIDPEKFKKIVDTSYFAANNLSDVIVHELDGHKKHWEAIQRFCENNNFISFEDAKEQLESEIRKYIVSQISIEHYYLRNIVSENAYIQFSDLGSLNECIADVIILTERKDIQDENLAKKVLGVLNYDGISK